MSKTVETENMKKATDELIASLPSSKLEKSINKIKNFKLDLDTQVNSIKEAADKLSRKEINLNFIDTLSRKVYTNPDHLIKVEFIQYIMFIVLLYMYNPFSINTKFPVFTKLLVLVVAFIYVILFLFIKMKVAAAEDVDLVGPTEKTVLYQFISTIVFFFLFMLAIKGVIWLFVYTDLVLLFRRSIALIIGICVLAIIYLFMKKTINKAKNAPSKGFLKMVLKIVLYLPCLLADMAEYIKYQFNLTTKPVWILMGVEGCLIGIWLIIPYLFKKLLSYDGITLLTEPVDLNKETTIGDFNTSKNPNDSNVNIDQLYSNKINAEAKQYIDGNAANKLINTHEMPDNFIDPNVPKNKYLAWIYTKIKNFTWLKISFSKHPQYTDYKTDRFSYKYALSAWFYINPQPPNTSSAYSVYTNILNYGKKIKIEYNGKLNSLRVMAAIASSESSTTDADKNESVEVYQTHDIMYQKWNNIVINYNEGYVDVFLNGLLVGSIANVVPYMSFDNIVAGATDGIMGGICNVHYYRNILSEKTIRLNYKTLRIKTFPYV
jgi:hypothetical protein